MVDDSSKEAAVKAEETTLRVDRRTTGERRKDPRFQFTASAEVVELPSGSATKARTSDLSASGCFVDTTSPSPEGAAVRLRLTRENRTFETKAVVKYSKGGQGMGLLFTDFSPEQHGVLERWIGELCGKIFEEPSGWNEAEQVSSAPANGGGQTLVLNELVIALMRKGVLSATEGKAMLQNLLG